MVARVQPGACCAREPRAVAGGAPVSRQWRTPVCASALARRTGCVMGRRPDPWRVSDALIVRADEARLLLPLVEAGLAEWQRRGAVAKVRGAADLLLRWRSIAESYDRALREGCAPATAAGGGRRERSRSAHEYSTNEAATRLGVSVQRVRQLAARGDLDARKVGHTWVVDVASVEARRRSAA